MRGPDPAGDRERLGLHNPAVHQAIAATHRCGMTHLATGRVCVLPERHGGGCEFRPPGELAAILTRRASRQPLLASK